MGQILYTSTRDNRIRVSASQAILQGLSAEGGLFVPVELPQIALDWNTLKNASYQEIASLVLSAYFTDFTPEEIDLCVSAAYDAKFSHDQIAPLVKIKDKVLALELFHGPTIAFKDMALTILPHLVKTAARKQNCDQDIVILTATSGDTGKAALAGFADVPGTKIMVLYPKGGVSEIQERQMVTQLGDNVRVIAIEGNFDDAQTAVKEIFNDDQLKSQLEKLGQQFSSANSINIGRLMPQVAYYIWTYAQLIQQGELQAGQAFDVTVPTGNFGNILAAYYAKQLGTPIRTLVCASNRNNVLVDFFKQGKYDRNRPFYLTSSPSMDILVSSNLERLVYELVNKDSDVLAKMMQSLSDQGVYQLDRQQMNGLDSFYANQASEDQVAQTIRTVFEQDQYLLDPHTAVAYFVAEDYRQKVQSDLPMVVVSTASPYKFPRSVMGALEDIQGQSDFQLVDRLHQVSGLSIPTAVTTILDAPILHKSTVAKAQIKDEVLDFVASKTK